MKLLIITVFILTLSGSLKAQCVAGTIKLPLYFHVTDTAHYWDYYNANGVVLWRDRPKYEPSLIPPGGFVAAGPLIKQPYIVKGFGIFYVDTDCRADSLIRAEDINGNNLAVKGRIIHPALLPR